LPVLLGLFIVLFVAYRRVAIAFLPNFSVPNGEKVYVYVYPNTTVDSVSVQLERLQVVHNAPGFVRYMKTKEYDTRLKPGKYRIEDGMTNRTLGQHLIFGMQEAVQLKFNNIRLKEQLAARLAQQLMVDSTQFIHLMNDAEFLKRYDMTPETVIAMFIPNTYEVYWDVTAEKLFDRMFQEYKRFWTEERLTKAQAANLTPVEVSTLASIVDEETNVAKDKPVIAGLYLNRMRKGMPLQACPTVKFALGDFALTHVLTEHTRVNSPYNTYKNRGLPPGPIRMASIAGIDAVLNYTKSNYIYMCAKETLNGEHNFATTLAEHNQNTQRYYRAYRQWERNKQSQK
jgi:UPF0755 protein